MEKILFITYHINIEGIAPNDVANYTAQVLESVKFSSEETQRIEAMGFLIHYTVLPMRHGESRMSITCVKEDGTIFLG